MSEINFETVRFIECLNRLAELSKNPFKAFADVTTNNEPFIIYDDTHCMIDSYGYKRYPVVLRYIADHLHHDIISDFDRAGFPYDFSIRLKIDGNANDFIEIVPVGEFNGEDDIIVIELGKWHID